MSIPYQIIILNNDGLFKVYNDDEIRKHIVFAKRPGNAVLRFYFQANDTLRHKLGEWSITVLDME